jgi:glycosyltransferase involved in cell wall biosynthesis
MTSEKKTVCFFNSNKAWGGGEKWHLTTCKELQRRGYNSFLVTNVSSKLAHQGIAEHLNVFSFYINNLSFLNPFKILTLAALFKTQKINSIILNLPADLKVAGIAAKLVGVKKIIYRRGMPHPLKNTWLNRMLFKHILTDVIVNSEEIGRSLKTGNEDWFPGQKMSLIYNGVDSAKPISHQNKLYTKINDELVLGNAGRLTEQKGQKYLIEMARLLKKRGINFKLLIAGEGELESSLKKQIEILDLNNEVVLLGHVQDMTAFLNSLDIFIFTSLYEGSANTLIETLQHGIPTIAFDISSNPEIIEHGKTGLLAKPFEISELVACVEKIKNDQELRNHLIETGQQVVKNKFDNQINFKKLEGLV